MASGDIRGKGVGAGGDGGVRVEGRVGWSINGIEGKEVRSDQGRWVWDQGRVKGCGARIGQERGCGGIRGEWMWEREG